MNIEKTKANLLAQKNGVEGNYRRYLVNIYNLYCEEARKNGTEWSPNVSPSRLIRAAYSGLDVDHMSYDMVQKWKRELKEMGYLRDKYVDGEWRTYILKELDF